MATHVSLGCSTSCHHLEGCSALSRKGSPNSSSASDQVRDNTIANLLYRLSLSGNDIYHKSDLHPAGSLLPTIHSSSVSSSSLCSQVVDGTFLQLSLWLHTVLLERRRRSVGQQQL